MKKLTILLLVLALTALFTYSYEMDLYFNMMQAEGVSQQEAVQIYETMPDDEKITVFSILAAKDDGDLDSLPPLKSQYENLVLQNPSAVNLINVLFEENQRRNDRDYHYGAKRYFENEEIKLNVKKGSYVEFVEMRWNPESGRSRVQLVVDGYTYADEKVVRGTQRFEINTRVNKEFYFIVRNAPVYVYNDYIGYDDFFNNDNEYGYNFIKNLQVGSSSYIDINKTISDFKIRINNGRANIEKIYMFVNNREYKIDVDKTFSAGSSFDHELARAAYVEYIRVDWSSYNRADASIFVKGNNSYNPNPTPTPAPSTVNVSDRQVSGPSQAESTYSFYDKVNQSSQTGQKVVDTMVDEFRDNNNREGLRAMSRGNFIIRKVSSSRFKVVWW
ncbi:MAG: hypothetical protein ACQESP_08210 [Candidatus Muiribacteriota bacterium]